MKVYKEFDMIYFKNETVDKLAYTDYTEELWTIISSTSWSIKKKGNGDPQYIYSNKLKKYLHQQVIDYYFGEDIRKDAYAKGMIIEHLDNNGFNCQISNLYFLLDVKNKYKGNYFDKLTKKSLPVAAMCIFHIIQNHTFQITIAFNQNFKNNYTGEYIESLKLLYNCDYCTVLQDAESILENIVADMSFSIEKMKIRYRFKDFHINHCPNIVLTENEKQLKAGNIIWRDGTPYIAGRFFKISYSINLV